MKQLSLFIMFTIVMVISFCSCTENGIVYINRNVP